MCFLIRCIIIDSLIEAGVDMEPSKVSGDCPDRSTRSNMLQENAAKILGLALLRVKVESKFSVAIDKIKTHAISLK